MKPLLAHVYEPHRVTYPCYVQPKLNGIRALYQNGRFQSRDEYPFKLDLLRHLAEPLMQTFGPEVILDGELYVHGWSLQRINGAVTPVRQSEREDTKLVEYHVFDQVDFKDSFENRHVIRGVVATGAFIHRVPTYPVTSSKMADQLYSQFVSQGYEGMMYRLGDCPYTVPKQKWDEPFRDGVENFRRGLTRPRSGFLSDKDNRCWHLLKRKDFQDSEFLITGFNTTEGEKGNRGFQLHCVTPSGKPFKVGGGLTQTDIDHYLANDPSGRYAKVKYLVLSEAGIPTGNPVVLAIL